MLVVAQFYWGGPAPCGEPVVRQARLPSPALADAHLGSCVIRLDAEVRLLSRKWFCAVIVHEVGHLHGLEHARREQDVMFPVISSANIPWVCRWLFSGKRKHWTAGVVQGHSPGRSPRRPS